MKRDKNCLPGSLDYNIGLIEHFTDGIGRRVFILTQSFPFLFIGIIRDVVDDFIVLEVETTHVAQLENRIWHMHVPHVEVFYIERDGGPCIPELTNG